MQLPTNGGRVLVLVGMVSFGLLLAGSGVVVGGQGAPGAQTADSAGFAAWAPAGSQPPIAQAAQPKQNTPANNNSSAGDGHAIGSNSSTGPLTTATPGGNGNLASVTETGPNGTQQNGGASDEKRQPGGPTDKPGTNTPDETNQGNPGNNGDAGPPDGQETGAPDNPGDQAASDNPGDQAASNNPGLKGEAGSDSPGAASNGTPKDKGGPPVWIDAPSGAEGNGFDGPPGLANGTSRTVSVGGENVTVTVSQGPPDGTPGVRAWAQITNATPNTPVPVALPAQARNATVRTEQLSIAVDNRRNVSLSVATGDRPTNETPEFAPATAAEGLGHISVAHTVPDEEIENVTFRFSVNGSKLEPDEREDVALYRYHNGTWNELETEYVDRNGTDFVFMAESPGLSAFTVGKKVASFQIQQATLLTEVQTTLDPVNVRVRVTNDGGADGVYTATLLLDEEELDTEKLSIAAGGTRQTSFEESVEEPGQYTVLVNNYTVGTLNVSETEDETSGVSSAETPIGSVSTANDEPATDETGGTSVRMPGFGFLVAMLGGGIAMWTRRLGR